MAVINCGSNTWNIYIGLPSATNRPLKFNRSPTQPIQLPAEATRLYDKIMTTLSSVLSKHGSCREDDSRGYSLSENRELRKQELRFRKWALAHQNECASVLRESSNEKQRLVAAHALGYIDQSESQIQALVDASCDPSASVRNNAIRALGCIASSRSPLASSIPPDRFIAMLSSGTWTDRNKAETVVLQIAQRNPAIFSLLKERALEPLCEISCWDDPHALGARFLLARATGLTGSEITAKAHAGDAVALLASAEESAQKSKNGSQ